MPNTVPLSIVGVLLGENGHPNGHSARGVFELEQESVCRSGSSGNDGGSHTRYSSEDSSVSASCLWMVTVRISW